VGNPCSVPVHSGVDSTVNIKTDQWPFHPDQHLSETPYERNLEQLHPESQHLDAQHPGEHHSEEGHRKANARKHVCGLTAGLFWIVLIVITVVIVGAAVGVGVGVSLARRSQSVESSPASSNPSNPPASTSPITTSLSSIATSSFTHTTTTLQSTPVTTTPIVGPSSTLYRDCPSSENTIHDITLGSKTYMFRKFCNTVLVTISNGNNLVNQATTDLNTCINKCALYNDANAAEIAAGDKPWYYFPRAFLSFGISCLTGVHSY
jgi:hypothetical protein